MATLTSALLLLLSPTSRAGTYVWTQTDGSGNVTAYSPIYSGGNCVLVGGYDDGTYLYGGPYNGTGPYGGGMDGGPFPNPIAQDSTNTASGEITATFIWQSAYPSDPPPASAVMEQDSQVYGEMFGTVMFAWDTGLGWTGTGENGASQTAYSVKTDPGQSFSVKCSPSMVATVPAGYTGGDGSIVSYRAFATPVTINLQGATADPNAGNALKALTGQQITATLNSPYPVTSYSWSVSGATAPNPFWTWDPTWPNSSYPTQFVPLTTAEMTNNSFSFYDAHGGDSVTVQCTATIQPPSGPPLTMTAQSLPIIYVKPTVSWVVAGSIGSITPGFYSDMAGQYFGATETWGPVTVTDPPLFYNPANPNTAGFSVFVQVASANRANTRVPLNGMTPTYSHLSILLSDGTASSASAPTGLDGTFPYYGGYYHNPDGTFTATTGNYGWLDYNQGFSADRPSQGFINHDQDGGGDAWNAATASDSFNTWIMYRPASVGGLGTIYVPLQKLTWSWGGTASLGPLYFWTVDQNPPFIPGTPSNTDSYPSWNLSIPLNPNIGP